MANVVFVAPFFGAAMALLILAEQPGSAFWMAAGMMGIGVWLHVTERHAHVHRHERLVHAHAHRHDEHHQHEHKHLPLATPQSTGLDFVEKRIS